MNYKNCFYEYTTSKGYLAVSTADAYLSDITQFEVWCFDYRKGARWSTLCAADIEDYISYMVSRKYEYSSICRALSALSSIFSYFVRKKMLAENPVLQIKRPRPSYHQREALDMEIIRQVLAQPNLLKSTRALISLIVESGLRIGECMSLRRDDIDLESRQIKVAGKGRSYRMAFFGDMTAKYLQEYFNECHLVLNIFPKSRREYNWEVYHACKPFAGAHKCSPHILRHTFATECLSQGMPMDVLMLTLGHKSIDTTLLYTHCQSSRLSDYNRHSAPRLA